MRPTLHALSLIACLLPAVAAAQQAPAQQTPVQQMPAQQPAPAQRTPVQQAPAQQDDDPEAKAPATASSDDPDAAESAASKVPLDEIKRYVAVYNALKEAYVDPVDDHKLMQSAIRGLLLDLDPHSAYLDRDAARAFDEDADGGYDGIGVEVLSLPDGGMKVVSAIDDTPAQRAGLKSGDLIVAVDGRPLTQNDNDQSPLRGAPGSKVVLTIVRTGRAPFDVSLQREKIRIASVRGRMLEPGYGYVRISQFQADTAADFEKALDRLKSEAGATRLQGLVVDLRSNPGGLLTSAVQIADDLLDAGKIVSTKGRVPISDSEFSATPGDRSGGARVAVLVDAGSASASEVLAGALRDNKRARIVGSRTFGKGSVQTLLPLDNGDSVKITTARYYTPSGRSIQGVGIAPDVVLHAAAQGATRGLTESSLPRHLRGEDEGMPGANAGEVLDGQAPIEAALAELKKAGATVAGNAASP